MSQARYIQTAPFDSVGSAGSVEAEQGRYHSYRGIPAEAGRHAVRYRTSAKSKRRVPARLLQLLAIMGVIGVALVVLTGYLFEGQMGTLGLPGSTAQSTPRSEWKQGAMPTLYQQDPEWSSYPYAETTFGESGCGPICLAMVYVYLTGDTQVSPTDVADLATNHGYASADGTSWGFMTEGAWMLGLQAYETPLTQEVITESLAAGMPLICIMGPGDFTSTGHFIVIAGIDEEGLLTVHDPNSALRTSQKWKIETIQAQCYSAWVYSLGNDQSSQEIEQLPATPRAL